MVGKRTIGAVSCCLGLAAGIYLSPFFQAESLTCPEKARYDQVRRKLRGMDELTLADKPDLQNRYDDLREEYRKLRKLDMLANTYKSTFGFWASVFLVTGGASGLLLLAAYSKEQRRDRETHTDSQAAAQQRLPNTQPEIEPPSFAETL